MQYATVTDDSPLEIRPHGSTESVPAGDFPDGMTLAVNDVVLFDYIGSRAVVVQRMNG